MDYKRRIRKKNQRKISRNSRKKRDIRRGLAATIISEGLKIKDPFESYAEACYRIERDLHQKVDEEYSVSRFLAQIELLKKEDRKHKMTKLKHKRGMGRGI